MQNITTYEAKNTFSDLLNRVALKKERFILTDRGRSLAAIIPMDELELLRKLEDRMDTEAAEKALEEPGTIPWEDAKKELGL